MNRTAALFLALIALPALADAPDTPTPRTPIQQYRHQIMELVGDHTGALGDIIDGEVERPNRDVIGHATALYELAQIHRDLFPEGSGPEVGRTRALPAVWELPDDFKKANKAFVRSTSRLVEAAKDGDKKRIEDAFGKVGESCGGCHKTFRKPRDKKKKKK